MLDFRLIKNVPLSAPPASTFVKSFMKQKQSDYEMEQHHLRLHAGDQRERWVGSGLLVAEKQFRRVQGHKQIPILLRELEALVPAKSEVVKRRKAS
jgi:hypothetical protein